MKMKKQLIFLLSLLTGMTMYAQLPAKIRRDSMNTPHHVFDLIKSKFAKPVYNYTYETIDNRKEFAKIELSPAEMKSVFDTLEANAAIRIDKTRYGVDLGLQTRFPTGFDSGDLTRIWKIEVLHSKLYNRSGHQLEFSGSSSTNLNKRNPKGAKGTTISGNALRVYYRKGIKDAVDADTLSYGSVEYKISFVSAYRKLDMKRSDISKSFKIDDDSVKLVDVFDNKVVLEQIDHHTHCINRQLLNLDSLGRKASIMHKMAETYSEAQSRDYTGELSMSLPQKTYLFFKNNPAVTYDEYLAFRKTIGKDEMHTTYIVLASPAPINTNFTIYFPVYGFSRVFTVSLKEKPKQK